MHITDYSFGKITIDGTTYQSDVIISSNNVKENWWREAGHSLTSTDLSDVIAASPEVVIIGTGYYGRLRVPTATRDYLQQKGIRVEIAETKEAVQRFNQLQQDCANIVAALHLTC